ncbi:TolC family protein [Aureicoccus marinus]|uniref:TolC family protein n=1 Tax=Aureicoccus marinus TaxID=754435 RepID=UPI001FE575D3|nr:TolC family protein [Aureicoccus marinus]
MMHTRLFSFLLLCLLLCTVATQAQEVITDQNIPSKTTKDVELLTKDQAVQRALEENLGVQVALNNVDIAKNNRSLLNSRFLPTVSGSAGASQDINDQTATFQDGSTRTVEDAETTRYNASVNVNYTLFDGFGRWYNYKRLKEEYNLSELQARETIETTLLQLFTVYFEVARLTENITVLEDTYANTSSRLQRAEYSFEFGQVNKLDVLNAQVDLVNDSINLISEKQALRNAKRDLNIILNKSLTDRFVVDTSVYFTNPLKIQEFVGSASENNVTLLQLEKNIRINDFLLKGSKSVFLPTIGLTGSYGWNQGQFPATNFLASNTSQGFSAGLNLTWNLFDGGSGVTAVRNARIQLDSQELLREQTRQQILRDIANALGDYENRLQVYNLQKQNVLTATDNYNRSNEQYKVGRITSIELRQAQINLLNAKTNRNFAKYTAKLAELQLLQLTGQLLNLGW